MSTTSARTPNGINVWMLAARPRTLWAAVAPVVLGAAIALANGVFHAAAAVCALLCAILIQVATNYSNDYHDFVKGADADGRKGPMRATQAGLVSPGSMRVAAILTFGVAFILGLYLVYRGGWPILAIGVLSIISGIWYTAGRYSLAYLGIADAFVLIFFGPVAVGGTYFVQALSIEASVVLAGVGLVSPGSMRVAAILTFGVAFILGLYLVYRGGWPILAIGVLSIISGIWYTAGRYSLAYLGIADAFVLIFFGPVAVGGTYFVQALSIEASVVLAGVGPGALAVGILLVNNIRDINEDRAAGKHTLIVRIGRDAGVNLYAAMFVVAGVLPLLLVTAAGAPVGVLAACLVPIFGRAAVRRVRREDAAAELNGMLAKTSQLLFVYCLVLSAGWFIG